LFIVFLSIAGEPLKFDSVISLKVLGILQFGCITFTKIQNSFGLKIWKFSNVLLVK